MKTTQMYKLHHNKGHSIAERSENGSFVNMTFICMKNISDLNVSYSLHKCNFLVS